MVAAWKAVLAQIEALPEQEQERLVQPVEAEFEMAAAYAFHIAESG